jgi:REP element-mobilizing transposase RayT
MQKDYGSGLAIQHFHCILVKMNERGGTMARPLRIEFSGAIYHVTSRGNARGNIFADNADRETFFATLATVVRKHRWLCHGYCLMDNHYHLLLETPEGNLASGMRQLNGIYTQTFNRRHDRVGHLLQGRYKAILVERDSYLLELCRYIVLNPVRCRAVKEPESWMWSSFAATAGLRPAPDFLAVDWILAQFDDSGQARQRYAAFVYDGMGKPSPWEELRSGVMLGREEFVDTFRDQLACRGADPDIPKSQRLTHRPGLEAVFAEVEEKPARVRAARAAHVEWGYTLKEIGEFLGVHYATVSRMVERAERELLYCKT